MLIAIFYPVIDGGFQQIAETYRVWRSGAGVQQKQTVDDSSSPSLSEAAPEGLKGEGQN